jgi:hypothetical protein
MADKWIRTVVTDLETGAERIEEPTRADTPSPRMSEIERLVDALVIDASEQGYTAFAAPVTHFKARAKVESTRAALLSAIARRENVIDEARNLLEDKTYSVVARIPLLRAIRELDAARTTDSPR